MRDRLAMYGRNRLKLGLFAANCSSGRAVTTVPERWPATWRANRQLAIDADDAGIDFLLPIGRWKGYNGATDFQGTTFETITWACGLLAATRRITVFGTVHAPLFHPVIAAKEFVTADHIGEGRFGLNIVPGWNEGEFEMFGATVRDHDLRYDFAQEWIDIIKRAWSSDEDFDFDGTFFKLKGVRSKPKPFGGARPVIMNAGASPRGRDFALRNCDAYFTGASLDTLDSAAQGVAEIRTQARKAGGEIGVYTTGDIVCRPTRDEAQDYFRYCAQEHVDWGAIDYMMAIREHEPPTDPVAYAAYRKGMATRLSGFSMVGSPDDVAGLLARLSAAGFDGIAFSFVNYQSEFPYFRDEVLPRLERLGLREPVKRS